LPLDIPETQTIFFLQIIMDNNSNIVYIYIQSGFLGHNNDSGQFQLMPVIGTGQELHLPQGIYILADKCYPSVIPSSHHGEMRLGTLQGGCSTENTREFGNEWNIASDG
jgi:hypothetical protein